MAKSTLSLRDLVDLRANGRCEYCRRYKVLMGETFFAVEHILPRTLGGASDPENLAFACRRCNLLKSDKIAALDPRTERQLLINNHWLYLPYPAHLPLLLHQKIPNGAVRPLRERQRVQLGVQQATVLMPNYSCRAIQWYTIRMISEIYRFKEQLMNAVIEFDVTDDVLTRLESQQTPLRIQGHQQSYYVLTVDQLLALMQPAQNFADDTSFSPADFGLTEADVTAYLARRHERQQKLGSSRPTQLPTDLQHRLERLRAITTISSTAVPADDQTMQALEAAMLRSLETTIQTMSQ